MAGTFEVATRTAATNPGFDLFAVALSLHKHLLVGAGLVVGIATYTLVAILAAGLVFGLIPMGVTVTGLYSGLRRQRHARRPGRVAAERRPQASRRASGVDPQRSA